MGNCSDPNLIPLVRQGIVSFVEQSAWRVEVMQGWSAWAFYRCDHRPESNNTPVKPPPTGFDALRTLAVSRIYFDNFDHITAY